MGQGILPQREYDAYRVSLGKPKQPIPRPQNAANYRAVPPALPTPPALVDHKVPSQDSLALVPFGNRDTVPELTPKKKQLPDPRTSRHPFINGQRAYNGETCCYKCGQFEGVGVHLGKDCRNQPMAHWEQAYIRKLREPRSSRTIGSFMAEIAQSEELQRQARLGKNKRDNSNFGYGDDKCGAESTTEANEEATVEQTNHSQIQAFLRTDPNEVPIVPRQMTWQDLRQVRGDQIDVDVDAVRVKTKRKTRKVDAKSTELTSDFLMNYKSGLSDSDAEVNFEAFPVRAKAIPSDADLL
ncbi:hypothetical protein K3495_g9251 [Podosphaera aphanis]|nr:hypothetical protein K3495_g9251 [Podosphaera aphanis]